MSEVTRRDGILNRPFTVSNLAVRASRQKPGQRTVSRREGGIRFDGAQVRLFCLGVLAQWTGLKLEFDRETRQITNNPMANQILAGMPPRKGWEEFYRV